MRRIRRSDAARQDKLDRRLYKAAFKGIVEEIKMCIAEGAQIVSPGPLGTALHAATTEGHLSACLLLLHAGAPANILGDSDYSPLHLTARHNHPPITAALINFGANLDIPSKFEWRTPLHVATKWVNTTVVELLLGKGASVDCRDLYGNTPLHMACQAGHIPLVEELLRHKADLTAYDNDGWSAMHFAASEGHVELVRLLAHHKSPLDLQNKHGRTPLHWAALNNHVSTLEALLALGADLNIKDCLDKKPKDVTSSYPIKDIIKLYESNLPEEDTEHGLTSLDLQLTLKPFMQQVSRMESMNLKIKEDTVSLTSNDLTSYPPQFAKCLTEKFGHDILKLIDECFGHGSVLNSAERQHARAKYKQLLMTIGSLLSVISLQVGTIYTTVSAALHNKSQTHITEVLKDIFEKLQCVEDNLADYQHEMSAEVRTLTTSLKDVIEQSAQNSPRLNVQSVSHDDRKEIFEQGHFLGKVAHCLTQHKECWRQLVPVLNPDLTDRNAAELVERIASRSQSEMDRVSTVLFSWQFYQQGGSQRGSLDTDALLQAVRGLQVEGVLDRVQELVTEYYNFTPLLLEIKTNDGNASSTVKDTDPRTVSFTLSSETNADDDITDC